MRKTFQNLDALQPHLQTNITLCKYCLNRIPVLKPMCPIQRNDFINIHTILHTHSSEASDNYKSVVKLREITKLPHFVRRRGYGLAIPSHTCKLAIHICMYIRSNCMYVYIYIDRHLWAFLKYNYSLPTHDALKYIASCNYFV